MRYGGDTSWGIKRKIAEFKEAFGSDSRIDCLSILSIRLSADPAKDFTPLKESAKTDDKPQGPSEV